MKTIASMAILFSFAGTALAQESVSPYRLGSWVPRDTNSCDTIYGDGRQLCLADRYHIQQDDKASEQQGSLQRAQEENQRLRNELLRRELAQTPSPSAASPTSTADFGSFRRSRFSADPPEGTIFSSTPAFRIRIVRYFIAFVWNALPSGPVVIVMDLGGAR